MKVHQLISMIALCIWPILPGTIYGQSTGDKAAKPASTPALYQAFFTHVIHLEVEGQSKASLTADLKKKVGLSEAEYRGLASVATSFATAIKAKNAEALAAVQRYRSALPGREHCFLRYLRKSIGWIMSEKAS